ncbi:hypothetical protein [Lacticaseibacillus paracasei]|uniref:hypothetical protein n=1 Tax=Lacticaseibacillus paracasei TaxID=1597 RepID=UPI0015FBEE2A|nr:hypothetical protein [Lacticaseibacillus paracasei]MBB1167260.1 hypothetical protein [Lacticaseibacillus paracasei]
MSEEKLYAVKNDEGEYWDFADQDSFFELSFVSCPTTDNEKDAKDVIHDYGGHIVTFVEEPEKEAVSESVGGAIDSLINADTYVQAAAALNYLFASREKKDFKRIMKAVRNGYTVKKNKYRVLAPRSWWYDNDAPLYLFFDFNDGMRFTVKKDNPSTLFTKEQLSAFGLDGEYFQKEEATDDDD